MYQCGTLPVFMETPRSPTLQNCLEIWKHQLDQQGSDGKYQYRFGETTIKNEKDQQFDRVFFSYSHDYGTTFSESKDISMSKNTWTGEPKMILMDDDVILVWQEEIPPVHTLSFAKSDDHGETLEKKYLWHGSRPDIVHYNNVLYLTWVDLETRQVLYTTSDNRGESFEKHKVIFAPKEEFSPYALKPEPKFVVDNNIVKIVWESNGKDFAFIIDQDSPLSMLKSKHEGLEDLKNHPLVDEFYAKYPDAHEEVRIDHISYFAGSDDGFKVRMNLYFDENDELDYINLKCYLNRELQTDVPGSFISKYLTDFTCDENGSQRNEN